MKILVVGSGGREHTLVWKLLQSRDVKKIYCAPGNAGIGEPAELVPINADDLQGLLKFARSNSVDLTVVGPELPLTRGILDEFEREGLRIFGPTKLAAEIEGSKVFAKQFMQKYRIPSAEFRTFDLQQRCDAERYINEIPTPIVIKADGLAAGKGSVICDTKDKAREVLHEMMVEKVFGAAGERVVIEEFMVGEEASILAITDGKQFVVLPPVQDHKRILDGERGKNTGGMGAYAPTPFVTEEIVEEVKRSTIRPTLYGLAKEGRRFKGCLYCGLMLTQTGPKAVCVVIASGGYPDKYETGKEIIGLDAASEIENVIVFHAGTKLDRGKALTSGGRVLGVTAVGSADELETTIGRAYQAVSKITFDGAYYRSDIGAKALRATQVG